MDKIRVRDRDKNIEKVCYHFTVTFWTKKANFLLMIFSNLCNLVFKDISL